MSLETHDEPLQISEVCEDSLKHVKDKKKNNDEDDVIEQECDLRELG